MTTLKQGANGADVLALQNALASRGFNPGVTDCNFGPGTLAAVIAFQQSEGMLADGIVGPATAAALGLVSAPATPSPIPGITVDLVCKMFPQTPRANIETHLPSVLDGLVQAALADKQMVLMALGTIRAEVECFLPLNEGQSKFNTSPGGHPFDLYDNRADLGNTGKPDGEQFRGRGFVQLTGRSNYAFHGAAIGMANQLMEHPELAADPVIASRLLASFLKSKEPQIRRALAQSDLKTARRLVNGGSLGLDRFTDAYTLGSSLIPDAAPATA